MKTPIRPRYDALDGRSGIEIAYLGAVEIGRVSPRGYWFQIRKQYAGWKPTKSLLAAKNGLERELSDWLRDTGLVQREET